jgi:hypothetical protein
MDGSYMNGVETGYALSLPLRIVIGVFEFYFII